VRGAGLITFLLWLFFIFPIAYFWCHFLIGLPHFRPIINTKNYFSKRYLIFKKLFRFAKKLLQLHF
jgi:hypothetical protein